MTTILTANFGFCDDVVTNQTAQNRHVEWVMVVEPDSKLLGKTLGPWTVQAAPIRVPGRPRLESRYPKFLPWEYVLDDEVIWIDANMRVSSPNFVEWAVHEAKGYELTCWAHPQRDCMYEEVRAASYLPKHLPQPMHVQAAHYRAEGYPKAAGLFACGTMVSDCTSQARRVLGNAMMHEMHTWTDHDQVSLPVVAWRLGIEVGTFDGNQLDNPYIKIVSNHR